MSNALQKIFEGFYAALSSAKGVGDVLVYAGFGILLVIGLIALSIFIVRGIKTIFNMTPGSFVIFIVVFSIVLIIIGSVLP